MTQAQWLSVLADSDLLDQIEVLESALQALRAVTRGGSHLIGRRLVPAVRRVVDAAQRVCWIADDVLWFEPPVQSSIAAVSVLVYDSYTRAIGQLDALRSDGGVGR